MAALNGATGLPFRQGHGGCSMSAIEPKSAAEQLNRRFGLLDAHIRAMSRALQQDDDASNSQHPNVIDLPPVNSADDELEVF